MLASCRIFVSRRGNAFMTEIAEVLVQALRDADVDTALVQEGLPGDAGDGAAELVVAPHEYFTLLEGRSRREIELAAATAVLVATEQPGTPWFATSLEFCRSAPLVLDINRIGSEALRANGIPALHLPLGYHRSWDLWHGDGAAEREIDILFMGALTDRREEFLAVSAPLFASYDCRFLLTDPSRPLTESQPNFLIGPPKFELLARSKVLLNVHQGGGQYFEWHRVLPALTNGCVVVTEPSQRFDPLRRFDHFVDAPLDLLAAQAVAVVGDSARRNAIAADAYAFVRQELSLQDHVEALLPRLARPSRRRRRRTNMSTRSVVGTVRRTSRRLAAAGPRRAGALVGDATDRLLSRTPLPRLDAAAQATQATLKTMLLRQAALARRLAELESRLEGADAAAVDLEKTPSFDTITPELTVGISLYNYENHVDECLESVLASRGVTPEIIVVDDRSTDRSRERVRAFMAKHAHYPIALAARRVNRGLSEARNLVFEMSRTPFVFLLDADNLVYPDALRKLHAALSSSDDAFAYSILERFGEQPELYGRTPGLVSAFPWDVDRLVRGNYIDAMSLVRKSSWEAAGGFNAELDERFGGWEDYAFWLSLAERRLGGQLVPEILGRYRSHRGSMLSTVNLDLSSIFRFLRARHHTLPWPTE